MPYTISDPARDTIVTRNAPAIEPADLTPGEEETCRRHQMEAAMGWSIGVPRESLADIKRQVMAHPSYIPSQDNRPHDYWDIQRRPLSPGVLLMIALENAADPDYGQDPDFNEGVWW